MKNNILLLILIIATPVYSVIDGENYKTIKQNKNSRFNFSYFLNFTGPTLDPDKDFGATYDRFQSGKDVNGNELDPTNSYTHFHSLSWGLRFGRNLNLFYSMAFVGRTHNDVEYTWKSKELDVSYDQDGYPNIDEVKYKENTATRNGGTDLLNQRINLQWNNIINNTIFYFNNKFSVELPTTRASIDAGMNYGWMLYPSINFYTSNIRYSWGILGKLEFYDFDVNQEQTFVADRLNCSLCDNMYSRQRTFIGSIGHYFNYTLNDTFQIKTTTNFDWDQQGEETGTSNFGNNLDDVFELGLQTRVSRSSQLTPYIQTVIDRPTADRTVLGIKTEINF